MLVEGIKETGEIGIPADSRRAGAQGVRPGTDANAMTDDGLIPCFTPGTRVSTLRGLVDVADITAGDRVLTRDQGFQPVRWKARTRLTAGQIKAQPDLTPVPDTG